MKKFYISSEDDLNKNELETKTISYARLCDRAFTNMIECDDIDLVDRSLYDNVICGDIYNYYDEDGNECTKEEYDKDNEDKIKRRFRDIFQHYLVNGVGDIDKFKKRYGDELILLYSNLLNLYVLAVPHFGTRWTYVATDIPYTTNFEEANND